MLTAEEETSSILRGYSFPSLSLYIHNRVSKFVFYFILNYRETYVFDICQYICGLSVQFILSYTYCIFALGLEVDVQKI